MPNFEIGENSFHDVRVFRKLTDAMPPRSGVARSVTKLELTTFMKSTLSTSARKGLWVPFNTIHPTTIHFKTSMSESESAQCRQWALEFGHCLSERSKIEAEIAKQFRERHTYNTELMAQSTHWFVEGNRIRQLALDGGCQWPHVMYVEELKD